jgi:hypothetical protein
MSISSNLLLRAIAIRPKVTAPPMILITKSIILILKSPVGRKKGRKSARLLSKTLCQTVIFVALEAHCIGERWFSAWINLS